MSGTVALQVDGPLSSRAVSPEGMLLLVADVVFCVEENQSEFSSSSKFI